MRTRDAFYFVFRMIDSIISYARLLVSPPHCAGCSIVLTDITVPLCAPCIATINPIASTILQITPSFHTTVHALGAYEGVLATLIRAKQARMISAARQLGDLMAQAPDIDMISPTFITAVPLHWQRYASRGYNQATEIGHQLSKHWNIPFFDVLEKNRATPSQTTCSKEERLENVRGSMIVRTSMQHHIKNAHVLLIDDVMTTGATLHNAARALLDARPASITCFVAARTR